MSYIPSSSPPPSSSASSALFEVIGADAHKRRAMRVTFSDAVLAHSPTGPADARNPSLWSVVPVPPSGDDIIAYTAVEVVRVDRVPGHPASVDVIVDDDLTFGVDYTIIADRAIQSVMGWPIDGTDSATALAYDPPCRSKPVPSIYDWFGQGLKQLDDLRDHERMAAIMQDWMEQHKALIDCMSELFDPLFCPESWLDHWLASLGSPFEAITSEMTAIEKRRLLLILNLIYQRKGTAYGIQFAIEQLLGISPVYVTAYNTDECWVLDESELGGDPYDPFHPGTYPTTPVDPDYPPHNEYTGSCALSSGDIEYFHAVLGPDDGSTQFAQLDGGWHLGDEADGFYLADPSEAPDGYTAPTPELNRRGLYLYQVAVTQALTLKQQAQVRAVAQYMQPAHYHLAELKEPPQTYDPVELDISILDHDWDLHA